MTYSPAGGGNSHPPHPEKRGRNGTGNGSLHKAPATHHGHQSALGIHINVQRYDLAEPSSDSQVSDGALWPVNVFYWEYSQQRLSDLGVRMAMPCGLSPLGGRSVFIFEVPHLAPHGGSTAHIQEWSRLSPPNLTEGGEAFFHIFSIFLL